MKRHSHHAEAWFWFFRFKYPELMVETPTQHRIQPGALEKLFHLPARRRELSSLHLMR
ncbi:MAG: hypothetical protein WCY58_01715 [Mariniphaga sp.]